MSCPSGHMLKDNMCTIAPTMTCPAGYKLMNGMCQPSSADEDSDIMGYGGDSMNMPPTQNGILSQTLMSSGDTMTMMVPPMSPSPAAAMRPPMNPATKPQTQTVSPSPAAAPPTMMGSPVSPMAMNNCPSGYSMNRSDNMCYPL